MADNRPFNQAPTNRTDQAEKTVNRDFKVISGNLNREYTHLILSPQQIRFLKEYVVTKRHGIELDKRAEAILPPSWHVWRRKRMHYTDIEDLANYRTTFFAVIGEFIGSLAIDYQVAYVDAGSHSKRILTFQDLKRARHEHFQEGHLTETLSYPPYKIQIKRFYRIEDNGLFLDGHKIVVAGEDQGWSDGLMYLQKRLEKDSIYLRLGFVDLEDLT